MTSSDRLINSFKELLEELSQKKEKFRKLRQVTQVPTYSLDLKKYQSNSKVMSKNCRKLRII